MIDLDQSLLVIIVLQQNAEITGDHTLSVQPSSGAVNQKVVWDTKMECCEAELHILAFICLLHLVSVGLT